MAPKKTARQAEMDVIDIGTVSEEQRLATQDGDTVREFLRGLSGFFTAATAIERAAKGTLEMAKKLHPPKTQDEDEQIQVFVKRTTLDRKTAEEHWKIASVIHGLHKRIVAGRTRATAPLEEANSIGNRLHNAYVEADKRRQAEEQERVRRQAEEDARIVREKELAELEAQALAREEASEDLSEREQMFVAAMTSNLSTRGDGQKSATYAGYKDAFKTAARLLSLPKIQQAIKAATEAIALRQQVAAKREAPLEVEVPKVETKVSHAVGFDRSTWGAECLNEAALIEACISGQYGIPRDVLTVNRVKLNQYGNSMHELVDRWPGVRHTKKTSVV